MPSSSRELLRLLRRVGVAIAGGALTLAGVAMIVLPGPAFVVLPAGLAILALEFEWAQRLLVSVREMAQRAARRTRGRFGGERVPQ